MNRLKSLNVVFVDFSQIEDRERYKAEKINELIREHPNAELQTELDATFIFDQNDAETFLRVQRAKEDQVDPNTIFIVTLKDENEKETADFLTVLHHEFNFQRVISIDWRPWKEDRIAEVDETIWGKRISSHWRNFWGIVKDTIHSHFFQVHLEKGFKSRSEREPRRAGEKR